MSHAKSRGRFWLEIIVAVAVVAAVFVWSEGLLHPKVAPGRAESRTAAWTGRTAVAESRSVPALIEAVGTVRAVDEAAISARVMGVIERIAVREGDRVRRGDLLAVVSAPELASQRAAAEGGTRAAEAGLEQARRDFDRMDYLYQREAVTRVEWERARTGLEQAEAHLAAARGQSGAAAAVASYTSLRAPFDGLVVDRALDPGALAAPGVPILRIVDDRAFRLEISLDEAKAATLSPGDSATVVIEALDFETTVVIAEVVPAADPGSRTALVKAALPRVDGLRSGAFGRLVLEADRRTGIVVPAEAVADVSGLTLVRVLDEEGRPTSRYVRTGRAIPGGFVEILSGLAAGEKVALGR